LSPVAPGRPALLTAGPIAPALLRLAWPVFLARALHTLYGVADTAWVGRLGAEAVAAVSTGFFASWALIGVGTMLVAGVTSLVSQTVGAGRDEEAARVVSTGLALAVAAGTAVAALGWFGAPLLFRALFDDPRVAALGSTYLSMISLAAPAMYVVFVVEAMYRSCGDSRTPMLVVLAGTLLNVILDPLLILGVGPLPRLEVAGAALATLLGEGVSLSLAAGLALRGRFPLPLAGARFSGLRAGQILRIGAPEAVIDLLFSTVYLVLAHVTGAFGSAATAALGIVNRMESVTYLSAAALGMAVATMVGQNLGAGQPGRAEASARAGGRLVTVLAAALTVVFLVAARPIVALFTSDPEVIRQGALFLRLVAISQVFMGWELVYGQAFVGAGDTLPPMVISAGTSIARIPLAWWLAFDTPAGVDGIWWTISLTGILRGALIVAWFRLGRWKERDLRIGPPAAPALPAALPAATGAGVPLGPEGPAG
jgi:putative MATE family efflux protein